MLFWLPAATEVVKALLKAGADPELQTHTGFTALGVATDENIKALLRAASTSTNAESMTAKLTVTALVELQRSGKLPIAEMQKLRLIERCLGDTHDSCVESALEDHLTGKLKAEAVSEVAQQVPGLDITLWRIWSRSSKSPT